MRFLNSFVLTFPRTTPLFLVLPKQLSSSSSFSVDFRSVSINIYSQPLVSIVYLFMQIFLVKPRPMAVSKLTLVQSRTGAMGLRDQYQSTYRHQWRMQNFPQGVRQLPKLILFFKLLTKTAWKWKNLDPRGGGGASLAPPLLDQSIDTGLMEKLKLELSCSWCTGFYLIVVLFYIPPRFVNTTLYKCPWKSPCLEI